MMISANRPTPRTAHAHGPMPARQDRALVDAASRAARRFQLAAQLHLARANTRGLQREGEALFALLWRMGFRPAREDGEQGTLFPLNRVMD